MVIVCGDWVCGMSVFDFRIDVMMEMMFVVVLGGYCC